MVHILELISLPQSIPSPKIFRINLHSIPIRFNRTRNILHFKILMTHECPCSKTSPIQLQSLPKIHNSFKMFSHQGIVIPNNTTCLRIIFIVIKLLECQISQLPLILFNIQNIGVSVHVLKAIRVYFKQFLEPIQTRVKLLIIVEGMSNLVHDEVRVFEET